MLQVREPQEGEGQSAGDRPPGSEPTAYEYGTSEQIVDDFLSGKLLAKTDDGSITAVLNAFEEHGIDFAMDMALDIAEDFEEGKITSALDSEYWFKELYFVLEDETASKFIISRIRPITYNPFETTPEPESGPSS
jgi:hypothetical protein